MAHGGVLTQVYRDDHGHGVVTCRHCGVTGPLTMTETPGTFSGKTFHVTCGACQQGFCIYVVCRRPRRSTVVLPGILYAFTIRSPLDTMTITSLSRSGIRFLTRHNSGCHVGEHYAVVFGLQEQNHAMVYVDIVMTRLHSRAVGAAFVHHHSAQHARDLYRIDAISEPSQ